jgi:hypothetical protein
MNEQSKPINVSPPGLISSITSGFNSVAGHIQLILFPLLLDLLLWFGPHIRLRTLVQPIIDAMDPASLPPINNTDMTELVKVTKEFIGVAFEHFNLVTALHTLPVGIPTLLSSSMPLATPVGQPIFYELTSFSSAFFMWIGFSLIGIIFASWYFLAVANTSSNEPLKINFGNVGAVAMQTLLLSILLIIFLMVLWIPFSLVLSIFTFINPLFGQISMIVMGLLFIWILIPFVFAPHGIFTHQLSAIKSILVSLRLVRRFLPGTGLFILTVLLLNEGLKQLWLYAPETSWMTLVGVFGHAFISTAVISATFFYYRSGMQWMQEIINRTVSNGVKA